MINRCHPNRHRYRRRVEFPGDWPLQAQLAPDALERLDAILEANPELAAKAHEDPLLTRGVVVAARASRAITSFLMDHPIPSLSGPPTPEPDGADLNAVRRFVEGRLVRTAVRDLLGMADMPTVGRELADTADAAAAAALAIAMTTNPGPDIPFTVIAMGKWGAQELNYASDIDVLFVYDTPDGTDPDTARRHANHLAAGFIAALADVTTEGIAYRVDADLRPEGRNGPLARSIDSYAAYYERWAHTWEYQSLIKARPAAGDPTLGTAFTTLITPYVYPDTLPPDAIRDIRTMKARIEHQPRDTTFHLKHGTGGIRDVEFAVQILQLVHGRFDEALRTRSTLEALAALAEYGYVREEDAAALADSYRWLRTAEHRVQLWDLRQTHALPDDEPDRQRVAESMGYRRLEEFESDLRAHRGTVRGIHEALFYRPLLEAFAASPAVRLSADGASRQLSALGFRDTEGARTAVEQLTTGLSRRSRLMRQTLPLMLDWLSETPDPDLGLEQLRMFVAAIPDHAGLVAALRDTPVVAERLCHLFGSSRLLGTLLDRIPELLPLLGDDHALASMPSVKDLSRQVTDAVAMRRNAPEQFRAVRRFVEGRLVRTAVRDLLGMADMPTVGRELADTADAAAAAALAIAMTTNPGPDIPFTVIAMGKWGAQELNYASDIDVLFVYDTPDGTDPDTARRHANHLAAGFIAALADVTTEGIAYRVDADLRPEGRNGPLARSIDSYAAYYERWAHTWEYQSLIKARPAAGDPTLGTAFTTLITPYVYPDTLPPDAIRDIRTMKARIEHQPRDTTFHLKHGPGGLSDVEFFVQLLQMRHGGTDRSLQAQGTIEALSRLTDAGALPDEQARDMIDAYRFCAHVRNRLYLQLGRPTDSIPIDALQGARLARSLGYQDSPRSALREDYRRITRRARKLVEQGFYRDL